MATSVNSAENLEKELRLSLRDADISTTVERRDNKVWLTPSVRRGCVVEWRGLEDYKVARLDCAGQPMEWKQVSATELKQWLDVWAAENVDA